MDQVAPTNPTENITDSIHIETGKQNELVRMTDNTELELKKDEKTKESNVLQEQPPVMTQTQVTDDQSQAVPNNSQQTITKPASTKEVNEELNEPVATQDVPWLKEAKNIMEELDEKPYEEEEASEDLQQKYMKKRFNVNIKKENE